MLGDIWWTRKCYKYSGVKTIPSQTGPDLLALSRFCFPQLDSLISKQGEQPTAHQPFPGTQTSGTQCWLGCPRPPCGYLCFQRCLERTARQTDLLSSVSIQSSSLCHLLSCFAKEASQPVSLNLCLCKICFLMRGWNTVFLLITPILEFPNSQPPFILTLQFL